MAESTQSATAKQAKVEYTADQQSLLDTVLAKYDDSAHAQMKGQIDTLVKQVVGKQVSVSQDVVEAIKDRIAAIDALLSKQLNAILHDPKFQKLEASWRGLNYLVMNTETSPLLKLRLLNVSKDELLKDLSSAKEFDQSQIFKKIYNPFDTYGGIPFGAVMGDYEFDWLPNDIKLLTEMSHVAAAAHAPFLAAASPKLFGWKSFADLPAERDLAKIFDANLNPDYIKWEQFRKSDDSRYVALVLPHVLMRAPYDPEKNPVDAFNFVEDVTGREHNKYLWGNAAYALAQRINQAFAEYGWHIAFCGLEGGGKVADLPLHTFVADSGTKVVKCPTEVIVRERRAGELIRLGLMPLVMYDNTDYAAFVDAPSCQLPKRYADEYANANAALSADLRCILAASRFTHYLKAICRDKQGSFVTPEQLQSYLQTWIVENYTVANADATQAIKSSRPLREVKVEVRKKPGQPGYYAARVWLAPHIPFKGLTGAVSMVAEMKSGK
jgi:type VI secretion system protein ImpC